MNIQIIRIIIYLFQMQTTVGTTKEFNPQQKEYILLTVSKVKAVLDKILFQIS